MREERKEGRGRGGGTRQPPPPHAGRRCGSAPGGSPPRRPPPPTAPPAPQPPLAPLHTPTTSNSEIVINHYLRLVCDFRCRPREHSLAHSLRGLSAAAARLAYRPIHLAFRPEPDESRTTPCARSSGCQPTCKDPAGLRLHRGTTRAVPALAATSIARSAAASTDLCPRAAAPPVRRRHTLARPRMPYRRKESSRLHGPACHTGARKRQGCRV